MLMQAIIGNAALAHPCAYGISASLHVIDVRDFNLKDAEVC